MNKSGKINSLLTLDSSFCLSKKVVIYFVVISNALFTFTSLANEDESSIQVSYQSSEQKLKNKSAAYIQSFLKFDGGPRGYSDLKVISREGDAILIGEFANYLSSIEFQTKTSKLIKELEIVRRRHVGRIDNEDLEEHVVKMVRERLNIKGYINPLIKLKRKRRKYGIIYSIFIEEGSACMIDKIRFEEGWSHDIDFPINTKVKCDMNTLRSTISSLNESLFSQGYYKSNLFIKSLQLDKSGLMGVLTVGGSVGKKVIYKIQDKNQEGFFASFFSDNPIESISKDLSDIESVEQELREYYKKNGYHNIKVMKPVQKKETEDQIVYTITVDPGKKFFLEDLEFQGNDSFTDDMILGVMGRKGVGFQNLVLFDQDKIYDQMNLIKSFYLQRGYWDVSVNLVSVEINEQLSTSKVVILIKEGKKRVYQNTEIKGNQFFKSQDVLSKLQLEKGQDLSYINILEFERQVRNLYLEKGFTYSEVYVTVKETEVYKDNILVQLVMNINEGRRVKIGSIFVKGLNKTKLNVVEREYQFSSDEWFDQDKILETKNRLTGLSGIFRSVQISKQDNLDNKKLGYHNLVVDLEEGSPGVLRFGPGYDADRGLYYTSDLQYSNLLGTNRAINLTFKVSEEQNQKISTDDKNSKYEHYLGKKANISFTEPYLLGSSLDGSISVQHEGRAQSIIIESDTISLSASKRYTFLSLSDRYSFSYTLRSIRDQGDDLQRKKLITTGDHTIGALSSDFVFENRESLSWPTRGSFTKISVTKADYFLGGQYKYWKVDFLNSLYFPLQDSLVYALNFSFTSFYNIERKEGSHQVLPTSERLTAHGPSMVRGFHEHLGPYVKLDGDKDFLGGGTRRVLFKNEVRKKLTPNIAGSYFIDMGNNFFSEGEEKKYRDQYEKYDNLDGVSKIELIDNFNYKLSEFVKDPSLFIKKSYISTGFSVKYLTPLGSINIAAAYPLSQPEGYSHSRIEGRLKFEVNIGTEF